MGIDTTRTFPPDTRVSTPASIHVPGNSRVVVRPQTPSDVEESLSHYGSRLVGWELDATAFALLPLWTRFAGRPVRAHVGDVGRLGDPALMAVLGERRPACVLEPRGEFMAAVRTLAAESIPVWVDTSIEPGAPDALLDVLRFYLHSDAVEAPIEPLHRALASIATGADHSLWHFEAEDIARDFFVTDDGDVTLSRRWAAAGLVYAPATETWGRVIESDLYLRIPGLPRALSREGGPCAGCDHIRICGSFLRATNPASSCEAWQRVFAGLAAAAAEATRILESGKESAP